MTNDQPMDRTHLPVSSGPRTGLITYDAKDPDSTLYEGTNPIEVT